MTHIVWKHLTRTARSLPRLVFAGLVAVGLLIGTRAADAKSTPEQTCQKGRYSAAAQYSACQQKAVGNALGGGDFNKFNATIGKCRTKYAAVWPKLKKKAAGSACDTARFTDNGTTVTDNLTGLQWEKKLNLDSTVNFADPHDADNRYSWRAALPFTAANGTAFTTFLPALNSGGCFAGQCDWRLPTIYELQTIVSEAFPCTTSPCIDPIFGPTVASDYWSATTFASSPNDAWLVFFTFGNMNGYDKNYSSAVRAVRAGS